MTNTSTTKETERRLPKKEILIGTMALLATVALSAAAIVYKNDLMNISNMAGYSLLGVLIVSFIAGSTVSITAIPVPYWLLVFTLPSILAVQWGILAPVWVGLLSALGATLGHIPTFMIGYGSRSLSQKVSERFNNRFYKKTIGWAERYGAWAVFVTSVILNPMHLPLTIAFGALRFPPLKWFFFSLLGNIVKSLSIAFSGYFGLTSLFRFLGV